MIRRDWLRVWGFLRADARLLEAYRLRVLELGRPGTEDGVARAKRRARHAWDRLPAWYQREVARP